jgi:hypothetical protein
MDFRGSSLLCSNAPGLMPSQQMRGRRSSRFPLEVNVGRRVPVGVEERSSLESASSTDQGGWKAAWGHGLARKRQSSGGVSPK